MAHTPLADVLGCVRTMLASQRADAMTDRQLLADFVERRDECAFAALVHRHSAMVHNVCRRTLRNATDAEDAFQATFLVLAQKAAAIRKAEALGNWLHHVAYRVALKLRTDRKRREQGTTPLVEVPEPDNLAADVTWREVRSILDDELVRLPQSYRAPLVLCYLEGKTQDEAAQILGWTLGTLRGRLQRGRERLRGRLERRGLPLSAVLLGATLVHAHVYGTASAALEVATVKAALLAATNGSAAGTVSAQAVALANGMIQTMFFRKVQLVAFILLGLAALGGGGLITYESVSNTLQARAPAAADHTDFLGDPTGRDKIIQVRSFTGHEKRGLPWVTRVVLTPDGRYAISAGCDALRCWDLESGKQTLVFGQLHDNLPVHAPRPGLKSNLRPLGNSTPPESASLPPEQRTPVAPFLYSLGSSSHMRNTTEEQRTPVAPLVDMARTVQGTREMRIVGYWSLAISKDGSRVIAGSNDGFVRVFDLKRSGALVCEIHDHREEVWGVALSADGKWAVTGDWNQSLRVWDVEEGKAKFAFEVQFNNVRCLTLSPDERFIAAGHFPATKEGRAVNYLNIPLPGTIRLWDVQTGKEVRSFNGHSDIVSSVVFSPDGKRLLSTSFDRTIRLWDVETGRELRSFVGHKGPTKYAAFTPDGRHIVSCGDEPDPTIKIWDAATGQQILESAPVARGLLSMAVLPDGRRCVTTGKDGIVRLWRWTK